jgi:hypothetical protein
MSIVNKKQGIKVLSEFMGFSKPFMSSWDALMQVVDKIESLDLSEYFYSWESEGEVRSNFMNIEVEIGYNKCYVECNLELDPPFYFNEQWVNKQGSLDYNETKIDAVFFSLVETVEEINKIRNK